MGRKLLKCGFMAAMFLVFGASLVAAQPEGSPESGNVLVELGHGLLLAVVYSVLGIVVLMFGFKIFDLVTPFNLNTEIAEKNNTAAGIVVAGIMIALGLIVAAAIA